MSSVSIDPMTIVVRAWRQWPEAAQGTATGSAGWRARGSVRHDGSICRRRREVVGAAPAHLARCETEECDLEHFVHLPALQREFEDHHRFQ